jgi:dihydrofolate reductase
MAELIVTEFVSVDGVMEAPGGEPGYAHTGWVMKRLSDDWQQYKLEEIREAGSHLLGRVTYESFAGAWPAREGEFADKVNAMPKYVASTTLRDPGWNNAHVLRDDVPAAVAELKRTEAAPILVAGSQTLVQTLARHDLVDEYRLMVFPVVLGSGRRLFADLPDKQPLDLADLRRFDNGVALMTYRRP